MAPPPPTPTITTTSPSSSPSSSSHYLLPLFLILILIKFPHTTQQQTPTIISNNTLPISPNSQKPSSSFKPSTAVVIGVLTTMFSLTFLLLLYIKHCNSVSNNSTNNNNNNGSNYNSSTTYYPRGGVPPLTGRKNSGIDRTVIESLPIFRFGSLMGQKEGLDCAVCLTKFEAAEVLRLLPKCKHAFHVECVDTWLDAHSTCPLCRYRVDPEDILLVHDTKISWQNQEQFEDLEKGRTNSSSSSSSSSSSLIVETRRISGRHSSVGERTTPFPFSFQTASFFRRSLDGGSSGRKKHENGAVNVNGVGCLVRGRKDGMLMLTEEKTERERRLEHRIIVSSPPAAAARGLLKTQDQRWSDVEALDLLYLTSEMIISGGERRRMRSRNNNNRSTCTNNDGECGVSEDDSWSGRREINTRSVSEITGLSRFLSNNKNNKNNISGNNNNNSDNVVGGERVQRRCRRGGNNDEEEQRWREEGMVTRWLAWISNSKSHLQTQTAVR